MRAEPLITPGSPINGNYRGRGSIQFLCHITLRKPGELWPHSLPVKPFARTVMSNQCSTAPLSLPGSASHWGYRCMAWCLSPCQPLADLHVMFHLTNILEHIYGPKSMVLSRADTEVDSMSRLPRGSLNSGHIMGGGCPSLGEVRESLSQRWQSSWG